MSRDEFSQAIRRQAYARSGGFCECGCGRAFGEHPKERPVYDHELPDFLGGTNDLENCKCVRLDCHQAKTAAEDMPRIVKVRREDKRRTGLEARKATIPGSRNSKFKRKVDGTVVPRE